MSKVQIAIDAAAIPCALGRDWRRAISDGEDYELCFTVADDAVIPLELVGVPMTRVGVVRRRSSVEPVVVVVDGEREIDATQLGWEHGE
jgi:thiamine monophosphate kinase